MEESFNIQATHDIIVHGLGLHSNDTASYIRDHYDHIEFPGSVPRTFVGALLLAGLAQPFVPYLSSAEDAQLLVRSILGLLVASSLIFVRSGVSSAYGKPAGRFFVAFITSQFHIMYYASRTLPNIFALILTNISTALLLQANSTSLRTRRRKRVVALYTLTLASVVFRSELSILLVTTTLAMLVRHRASLWSDIIPAGLLGGLAGLVMTIGVDTVLWCRWTWPELEGFYFNTILGKSSDWGTSRYHFYFTNALPRLMLNPVACLVCVPFAPGLRHYRGVSRDTLFPHLAFILIYSAMPHKEWRFVIYSVPALTAVAAGGAAWIWARRDKDAIYRWITRLISVSIVASYALSLGLLWISSLNYPGGEALHRLHRLETAPNQRVHVDNLASQTGVTWFLQSRHTWTYDKCEDQSKLQDPAFWQQFDYVIAEDPKSLIGNWQVKEGVVGYSGITFGAEEYEDMLAVRGNSLNSAMVRLYNAFATVLRKRLTGGRWPVIKFHNRLYILERERFGLKDETTMTIQM